MPVLPTLALLDADQHRLLSISQTRSATTSLRRNPAP
jgi:hypothetical protein